MLCHINGRIVTVWSMLTQAVSIVYEAAITNLIDLLCFLFFILDICGAIFVYHILCNYGQILDPNLFGLIFSSTHYVANYKIIYVYYLNKLHDL